MLNRCLKSVVFAFLLVFCFALSGQSLVKPAVKFGFNNMSDKDDVSELTAKVVGASFTSDRFGNENNAVFLFGNPYSYVNLGTDARLKPKNGSISIWVKVEHVVWAGKGHLANPIILTKNSNSQDFYESYALYFFIEDEKIIAVNTLDSLNQMDIVSSKKFKRWVWHHLVISYDASHFSLYIDGKLESTTPKNFETVFSSTDSVMVGVTASEKNNRFFQGAIDDIEIFNKVLSPEEVNELYNSPDPNKAAQIIKWIEVTFIFVILVIIIYLIARKIISKKLVKEKHELEISKRLLQNELSVNRAQMNPHFIFNSLNSIQQFVMKNENTKAELYLSKFAKLIRELLESNVNESLTIRDEITILEGYLEMEMLRFGKSFSYTIHVDEQLNTLATKIPHMLIQPFVEHSIWQNLLTMDGERKLSITFIPENEKTLKCSVTDNGAARKTILEKDGLRVNITDAIKLVKQRLALMSRFYKLDCYVNVEELKNENGQSQGTRTEIVIPIIH